MKKILLFFLVLICFTTLSSCNTNDIEPELLSIEVLKTEGITVYKGDIYEPKGVQVNAIYENKKEDVTSLATFSKIDTETLGFKTVYVSYQEKESSYQVEVIQRTETHSYKLRVKENPEKILYYVGEELNLDGLVLVMVADDTIETIIDKNLCTMRISLNGISKVYLDETGTYQITFTLIHQQVVYTTYLHIEVIAKIEDQPADILVVDEQESKLSYWTNEEFDPAQLVIYIQDEKTSHRAPIASSLCTFTLLFNGIVVDGFKEEGIYTVKVDYATISCTANLTVQYRRVDKRIELDYSEAKIRFSVGEAFSSSGLIIRYYEDEVFKRIVSNLYCKYTLFLNGIEQEKLDLPGTYSVQVEFEGVTEGYKIVVI